MKTSSSTSSSRDHALRFLRKSFFGILPLALAVGAVSYFGDAGNMYHRGGIYDCLSDALSSGKIIRGSRNQDDRLLKKKVLEKLPSIPDIVILGSSRTATLGARHFPGSTVFNLSFPGGTLSDQLAAFYQFERKGAFPRALIVTLDPWLFSDETGMHLRGSLEEDARKMRELLGVESAPPLAPLALPEKYLNLISPAYAQRSLAQLWGRASGRFGDAGCVPARSEDPTEVPLILPDGSVILEKTLSEREEAAVSLDARKAAAIRRDRHRLYLASLDAKNLGVLRRFVDHARKKNVAVFFFLPPYHPETYQALLVHPESKLIADVEKRFIEFAKVERVPVIGSYDPRRLGLTGSQFYDGSHGRAGALATLFETSGKMGNVVLRK